MNIKNKIYIRLKIILAKIAVFFAVLCFGAISGAQAQSLYLAPASGQYSVSGTFSVKLYFDSPGVAVNAAQATINFPSDLLEVKSVSKEGSVFTLWPQEPNFSNSSGTVNFSGGMPAPGATGTGKILTINFKAKKDGEAVFSITNGVLLKADGKGTNVLSSVLGASYKLVNTGNIAPKESSTANSKVPIDTIPPDPFNIKIDNYGDLTSPQPSLYFETKDSLSGVKNYEAKIDDKDVIVIESGKTNPFVLPLQVPGTHRVSVWAVDRAGNKTEARAEFEIKSIEIPEILIYTKSYNAGEEIFYLEGSSIPNSKVSIFFEGNGRLKTWQTFSDSSGNWSFITNELFKSGIYSLYAKSEDKRGAVSSSSSRQDVKVVLNGVAIGSILISYYSLLLIIVGFILLITILMAYIYKKMKEEKIKIKIEVDEARLSLEAAFKNLRKKIAQKIEYFDGKSGLSPEEKKMRDSISEILNSSEKIVEKEIKDIDDELTNDRWIP